MKTIRVLGSMTLVAALACVPARVDLSETEERNGRLYSVESSEPVSGVVYSLYEGSDQIETEVWYRRGIKHGSSKGFHTNGRLRYDGTFVNGEIEGIVREWTEDGVLVLEQSMAEGKVHGTKTTWYPSGQMEI